MNPFFIFLVLLAAVVLWFLLAFIYKPLGKIVSKIINDSFDIITDKDDNDCKND